MANFILNSLRAPVKQIVSEHTGQRWTIKDARDMTEFACHPCAILSDGSYAVFAKFSDAVNGGEQFEIELAGLRLLAERSGVLIPTPVGIIPVTGGSILVLEAAQAVERTPHRWRQIGQALACIHQVKGKQFGLETQGYFGPLPQDNTQLSNWVEFYAQRRLWPGLRMAIASGSCPPRSSRRSKSSSHACPSFAVQKLRPRCCTATHSRTTSSARPRGRW